MRKNCPLRGGMHDHQTRARDDRRGRGLVFPVATEVQSLRHEQDFKSGRRAAKPLVKGAGLRRTLVLILKDFGLDPEATPDGASIEVVVGRVRIQAEGRPWHVGGAGKLIAPADNLRGPITALQETAFRLVLVRGSRRSPAGTSKAVDRARGAQHHAQHR